MPDHTWLSRSARTPRLMVLAGHEQASRHGGRDVAAFDFDDTLIDGDSLLPFLSLAVGRVRVGRALAALGPKIAAALLGVGERDAAKAALLGRLLRGFPANQLAEIGQSYAHMLADRLRPDMVERVEWHRVQGHRLVIVSASLTLYLVPLAEIRHFDKVLATALEVGADGLLTGRLLGANVRGREKVLRLSEWLAGDSCRIWAYGNRGGDRFLLSTADQGYLIRRGRVMAWTPAMAGRKGTAEALARGAAGVSPHGPERPERPV